MSTLCPECRFMGTPVGKTAGGRVVFTCRRCPEQLVEGFDGNQILSGPRWLGDRPTPPPAPHAMPRALFQRRTDEPTPRFKARGGRR
jgi:hypothetical protein